MKFSEMIKRIIIRKSQDRAREDVSAFFIFRMMDRGVVDCSAILLNAPIAKWYLESGNAQKRIQKQ